MGSATALGCVGAGSVPTFQCALAAWMLAALAREGQAHHKTGASRLPPAARSAPFAVGGTARTRPCPCFVMGSVQRPSYGLAGRFLITVMVTVGHGEEAAPIYLGRTSRQASRPTAAEARRPDPSGWSPACVSRPAGGGGKARHGGRCHLGPWEHQDLWGGRRQTRPDHRLSPSVRPTPPQRS
jgi:hypothetical protein